MYAAKRPIREFRVELLSQTGQAINVLCSTYEVCADGPNGIEAGVDSRSTMQRRQKSRKIKVGDEKVKSGYQRNGAPPVAMRVRCPKAVRNIGGRSPAFYVKTNMMETVFKLSKEKSGSGMFLALRGATGKPALPLTLLYTYTHCRRKGLRELY